MEIWKLLFILVVVCALGTFAVYGRWIERGARPFALRQSHLRHVMYEGFGGGFGVGFNGGFGVGANGGFGTAIEPNFGSVGVDDKKKPTVESFYGGGGGGGGGHGGGGHGGGGHGGGGHGGGGHGGHGGGGWHGPGGYGGPNQGTWRGWGGDGGGWGWYGWSYPWAWYGPIDVAVACYSDADCDSLVTQDRKSFCASNGYCARKGADIVAPVGIPDAI